MPCALLASFPLMPSPRAGKYRPVLDTRLEEHRKRLDWWKSELQTCCRELGWLSLSVEQVQAAYTRRSERQGSLPVAHHPWRAATGATPGP